jgi:hypothetical protein
MSGEPRLLAYRDVLRIALRAYLVALRRRWDSSPSDAAEVERVVAAVGAVAEPEDDERQQVDALLEGAADDAFAGIADALGLSPGEQALVAAAWWAEADPQLAVVLGCAHDDATRRAASAALLDLVLGPFGIDVPPVSDDRATLVSCGVLEPGSAAAEPLRLTPTARAVIAGLPLGTPGAAGQPAPRLDGAVVALARHLSGASPGPVVLRGPSGIGRAAVAAAAAERLGLVAVTAELPAPELRLVARAGIGVPVVAVDRLPELGWRDDDGPLVAIATTGTPVAGGYVVDLPGLDFRERELLWATAVAQAGLEADAAAALTGALSSRFAFTDRDVAEVMARAARDAGWHERPVDAAGIWDAARRQPEHALQRLASLVTPAFTLDDLVLGADARAQLGELVAHVELQHVVLDGWGFRRRLPRGQGVIALFAGPPGTGKTMAAEAVAHALGHDLYRVDLSAVVSKYIGETEKNLASAFDEAERASAVLFFDEADSLFGKRTEVRDSHDRYANLEVNYLLQRVETFTGLVILATNRHSALDDAFVRRLRFVIRFELPDAAFRAELWQRSFPSDTAVAELDWQALASAELSGGSIQSAALAAAYLAAGDGGVVTRAHVDHAMRREYDKLGRAWTGSVPGVSG